MSFFTKIFIEFTFMNNSGLVKGLEFDVVIIANASKKEYSTDPLDVKLLYIAMTRPLHRLYIYSVGEKTRMLSELKEAN
jgi:DNA helicase-2/ATP-dependent DNA helicase PcrA